MRIVSIYFTKKIIIYKNIYNISKANKIFLTTDVALLQRRLMIINKIAATMHTKNKYSSNFLNGTNYVHIRLEHGDITYDHYFNPAQNDHFWGAVKFLIDNN